MALNLLEELRRNKEFAKLSFQNQMEIKYNLVGRELSTNRDFLTLSFKNQKDILEELAFTPPVVQNPNLQVYIDNVSKAFKSADPKARASVQNVLAMQEISGAMSLKKTVEKYITGPLSL